MKIAIASDHAGFDLKQKAVAYLKKKKHTVSDLGPFDEGSVDYPDYAKKVARRVAFGRARFGILICGSGIGMSMAANKTKGVRAASCESLYTAKMSRLHNDSNILCIGARILPQKDAIKIISVWLATEFEGGRHRRRVKKIG